MFVCSPPSAVFSAGAMTVANRIGVTSGTAICRGLLAVSAARRRASDSSAVVRRVGRRSGRARAPGAGAAMVPAMGTSLSGLGRSGGVGERRAGEVQVDVVERGRTRRHGGRAHAELV